MNLATYPAPAAWIPLDCSDIADARPSVATTPPAPCEGGPRIVVAVSPDGATAAVAAWDRPIRLYRRADGRRLRTFSGKSARSLALAFAPDGRTLASAGADGRVRIWDPAREVERRELSGHSGPALAVAFSPDGALLASAGVDGLVRLWEPDTGRLVRTFDGDALTITSDPDGKDLAL